MSDSKRTSAPPVPCAVWLRVQFTGRVDNAARRLFAERLSGFVGGTGIKPIVAPRLIGLHCAAGFVQFEISLIMSWLAAQREVDSVDFMSPVPTLLRKGVRHG